jgi:hypothetical protein
MRRGWIRSLRPRPRSRLPGSRTRTFQTGTRCCACMLKNVGTVRLIDPSLPSSNLMSHCSGPRDAHQLESAGPARYARRARSGGAAWTGGAGREGWLGRCRQGVLPADQQRAGVQRRRAPASAGSGVVHLHREPQPRGRRRCRRTLALCTLSDLNSSFGEPIDYGREFIQPSVGDSNPPSARGEASMALTGWRRFARRRPSESRAATRSILSPSSTRAWSRPRSIYRLGPRRVVVLHPGRVGVRRRSVVVADQ